MVKAALRVPRKQRAPKVAHGIQPRWVCIDYVYRYA